MVKIFLPLWFMMFAFLAKSAVKSADEGPYPVVRKMGFMPIYQELSPVGKIRLPLASSNSGERSIADEKGKWLFLVFFATWCGPCAYEMPILESMFKDFSSQGFSVLGVSIDQGDILGVKKYVKSKNLTFPVIHDSLQQLTPQFQSSGVPTLYLISPDQKVVGVFQGANQWNTPTVLENLKKLLTIKEVTEEKVPEDVKLGKAKQEQTVYELSPPKVEVSFVEKSSSIQVSLSWTGDSAEYLLRVPTFPPVEGVEVGDASSYTEDRGEKAGERQIKTHFLFPVRFLHSGEFAFGPIEVSYNHRRFGGGLQFTRSSVLHVEHLSWWRLHATQLAIAGLALLFMGGGIAYLRWRKKNAGENKREEKSDELQLKWAEIQSLGLRKKNHEYEQRLLELYCELQKKSGLDVERELIFLQEMRYGGRQLALHERESFEKKIERELTIPTGDPHV